MARWSIVVVALSLAFSAVVGTLALTRTVRLGQAAAKPVAGSVIAKRANQLDRFEASLRAELRHKPPAVPKLPPAPVATASPAPAAVPAASQRVVYVRPAPIVIHKHRAGGESEGSDRGDGGGGAGDD